MTVAAIIIVLAFLLFFSLQNYANGGLFFEAGDFYCCSRHLKVADRKTDGGATYKG